jgi:hypothetical protein
MKERNSIMQNQYSTVAAAVLAEVSQNVVQFQANRIAREMKSNPAKASQDFSQAISSISDHAQRAEFMAMVQRAIEAQS